MPRKPNPRSIIRKKQYQDLLIESSDIPLVYVFLYHTYDIHGTVLNSQILDDKSISNLIFQHADSIEQQALAITQQSLQTSSASPHGSGVIIHHKSTKSHIAITPSASGTILGILKETSDKTNNSICFLLPLNSNLKPELLLSALKILNIS